LESKFNQTTDSAGGNLYAVNRSGTRKWVFGVGYAAQLAPAIAASGTIYISAGENLYAVNSSGTLRWKFADGVPRSIWSSPAISADGAVYFGSLNGNVYAVGPAAVFN